jgi:hypothetical protein
MITNPTQALEFILAGNARFTLKSKATGKRYTYKVSAAKDKDLWFVSSLYGSDNTADYAYMGIITAQKAFRITAKSRFAQSSPQVKAFEWAFQHLYAGNIPESLEVWHEGHCGRCGRALTVPESIASGIGPECSKRIGKARIVAEELFA